MRTGAIILSTTMAGLLLVGCSTDPGVVFELATGDCFDALTGSEGEDISDVTIVECAEAHDHEVFHTADVADGDFPGEEALTTQAQELCASTFAEYVGTDWANSRLDIVPLTPSQGSWDNGDRAIVCAVADPDGAELTGSVGGSEQ